LTPTYISVTKISEAGPQPGKATGKSKSAQTIPAP